MWVLLTGPLDFKTFEGVFVMSSLAYPVVCFFLYVFGRTMR